MSTPSPEDPPGEGYVCPFCDLGQCARCHDIRCTCCQGAPDDGA